MSLSELFLILKGSSTSGNFAHTGRPGKVGGSGTGGGHVAIGATKNPQKVTQEYRKKQPVEQKPNEEKVYPKANREKLISHYNLGYNDRTDEFTGNCGKKVNCDALNQYTGHKFREINASLRAGNIVDKKLVDEIDRSISNLPRTPEDMTTFRGVGKDLFDKLKQGSSFTDDGFSSTTIDEKVAKTFGKYQIEIRVPKGSKGVYVERVSDLFGEKEFLLPRGSKFNIISKKGKKIIAELIDD